MASKKFKFESKASKKQKEKRGKVSKLDPIRAEFRSLVERANRLISQLAGSSGGLASSPTYIHLFGETGAQEMQQFNIDDKHRFREIRREMNRVNEFLTAEDNTEKGTEYANKIMTAIDKHQLSFQHQNIENGNVRFANKDQDRIKFAMQIYRRIIETESIAIGKGKGQFGSDNLINLIYDELENYNPNLPQDEKDTLEKNLLEFGYDVVDQYKRNSLFGFLSGSPNSGEEVGIVEQLKKSRTADEFFDRNPWLKENKQNNPLTQGDNF